MIQDAIHPAMRSPLEPAMDRAGIYIPPSLLLEDGVYLLLEDGTSKLLLEA